MIPVGWGSPLLTTAQRLRERGVVDLPTIDFRAADADRRFVSSMHDIGFAILVGHPLDADVLAQTAAEWLGFFGRDAKYEYLRAPHLQSGYFPPPAAGERVAGGQFRDRKEFFQIRVGGSYPSGLSGRTRNFFDQGLRLATSLLGWLDRRSTVAGTDGAAYAGMIAGSAGSTLRIQHYLPLDSDGPPGVFRALEHQDLNLITLLPAPTGPGLQVKTAAGDWLDVPFRRDLLIVNAGLMLEKASGGHFPATPHRVLQSGRPEETGSRMSFPLFVHPRPDVDLGDGLTAQAFLSRHVARLHGQGWAVAPGGEASDG